MASPGPAANTNQLQITDLAEVLRLLSRHGFSGVSYYTLGLYLGLSPATLDVITRNNEKNTESCLRECLTKWLQKADDVQKKGGPTVSSLVSALKELNDNAIADGIDAEKHPACKILADYTSNKSLIAALPQLAKFLHSEDLIKDIIHSRKGEILMIEIVKAICIDSNKLEMFAAILIKNKATMEIGKTIRREYRKVYDHHESDNDLAKKDEFHLPPSLTSRFKSMRMMLGSTFDQVEIIIGKCPPSTLDKIKNILMYYSQDLKPQVAQCDNIHDILELVRKDCSLDDIEMLKAIVNKLNIEEAKAAIQEYSEALEEFSETELSKCLNKNFSDASPLQCEKITIVVDRNTDDYTLNDVRRLSANIFHKLSPRIKLIVIRDDNSFTITCSFPLILSEQVIESALNNIDVLKENEVLRLTIGYYTVYEANKTIAPSTSPAIDSDENQKTSPTSSGLFQQLMLSLNAQLINSTEEELMNKIPNVRTMENEILRQKSDETGQFQPDEASNVANKIQPTKQLPLVPSTEEVLVFTAKSEAASAVNFDDNKVLELAEGNLQKGISPMRQEMESTIFEDEREDLGKV
ncbi:PREDICTED: uncharacterized protein LOC109582449 [Amphimedon queenslandica]|uniref:Death domain-containing protein n=1 Tax=Amphimedon queenslandica TaxID=400682 RepID=A0AAN0J6S2_AMPQE|nr:PREDICTED: uncharacterized protein LOC109582449 [Amphimedon queenslandica]|eukprot:XP_019852724.1 PREDICTED: uncharacterized protein LOC109582449 [Amphimedon queenslandica]